MCLSGCTKRDFSYYGSKTDAKFCHVIFSNSLPGIKKKMKKSNRFWTTMVFDDAVKFTSEMHDPCAQTVTYKREENTNTLRKAPVWSQPNTLRKLSQKSSYNSRVLERGQLCVP